MKHQPNNKQSLHGTIGDDGKKTGADKDKFKSKGFVGHL